MCTFTEALGEAGRLAKEALPPVLHTRIDRGTALVKQGKVFQTDTGTWEVQGSETYAVGIGCTCPDYLYNMPQYCKHQLAVFLYRRAKALLGPRVLS